MSTTQYVGEIGLAQSSFTHGTGSTRVCMDPAYDSWDVVGRHPNDFKLPTSRTSAAEYRADGEGEVIPMGLSERDCRGKARAIEPVCPTLPSHNDHTGVKV